MTKTAFSGATILIVALIPVILGQTPGVGNLGINTSKITSDITNAAQGILKSAFPKANEATRSITRNDLLEGLKLGFNNIDVETNFISGLSPIDFIAEIGSTSSSHFRFFRTTKTALDMGNKALRVLAASKGIAERMKLTPQEAITLLSTQTTLNTELKDTCPRVPTCTKSKYRTVDGSCNNLGEPSWGQSRTPMQRILLPAYADGIFEPRVSVTGAPLPSARFVSASLIPDFENPRRDLALFTVFFGQFVDHEFNLVPIFTTPNGSAIECCTSDGDFVPVNRRHPRCFPIEIPANDPFYGPLGRRCMNFVRSIPGLRTDCTMGYADQLEDLTHWIDGSQIYGSTEDVARNLREFSRGRLRTSNVGGPESLPLADAGTECGVPPCFVAGDVRVTENQPLTTVHSLWMREHNRVAAELLRLNPWWNDEITFQETRRIIIAQFQHIVYNEFLPVILGPAFMRTYNLLTKDVLSYDYDPSINPNINNEFAAAAFRMGHTLLQGMINLFTRQGTIDQTVTLSGIIQNSAPYSRPGFRDEITRSLLQQPPQTFDESVTREVTTKLFRGNNSFGLDLVALNLQRSRDHGIPGYNSYREVCGLPKALTFDELAPDISSSKIQELKNIYRHVDDVDLFIGGLYEDVVPGATVGRTFLCIIGDQFTRLKRGDRFFYDLGGQPHSFSQDQLVQIRKASLARIICDNSDEEQIVRPSVLLIESPTNPKLPCTSSAIPRVDLSLWAGEPIYYTMG